MYAIHLHFLIQTPLQKRVVDRVLKWPSRLGQCVWVDNKFRGKCEDVKILERNQRYHFCKNAKTCQLLRTWLPQ